MITYLQLFWSKWGWEFPYPDAVGRWLCLKFICNFRRILLLFLSISFYMSFLIPLLEPCSIFNTFGDSGSGISLCSRTKIYRKNVYKENYNSACGLIRIGCINAPHKGGHCQWICQSSRNSWIFMKSMN